MLPSFDLSPSTMDLLILTMSVCSWIIVGSTGAKVVDPNTGTNASDANKDMYVINAIVYQVGIITNKTDGNITDHTSLGNQESVTFFRNNGTEMDLSGIPAPLMTNVTAQRMVGVAPKGPSDSLPWSTLQQLASIQTPTKDTGSDSRVTRDVSVDDSESDENSDEETTNDDTDTFLMKLFKRSVEKGKEAPVEIVQGTAAVPEEVGVQSIGIPPLLTLNNNFSEIPVPIPNMSVVHYEKLNTLVKNVP